MKFDLRFQVHFEHPPALVLSRQLPAGRQLSRSVQSKDSFRNQVKYFTGLVFTLVLRTAKVGNFSAKRP